MKYYSFDTGFVKKSDILRLEPSVCSLLNLQNFFRIYRDFDKFNHLKLSIGVIVSAEESIFLHDSHFMYRNGLSEFWTPVYENEVLGTFHDNAHAYGIIVRGGKRTKEKEWYKGAVIIQKKKIAILYTGVMDFV